MASTLADMAGNVAILLVFCCIINMYGTAYYFLLYFSMWFLGMLCTQSVSHIIAMVTPSQGVAVGLSVAVQTFFFQLSNGNPFKRDLHYSLQIVSEFSHIRMMWESIVISIYNVCENNEFSTVLYAYDLKGDEFWPNVIRLVIIAIFWKLISIWICCFKNRPKIKCRPVVEKHESGCYPDKIVIL